MSDQPSLDLALAELRGVVEVGFERSIGQNALILQRLDQAEGRHAELVRRVDLEGKDHDELAERVQTIERQSVTRDQLAERTRQIIAVVGLMVTIAGVVIALISLTR